MKKALSSSLFLVLCINLSAQFSLRVGDPRNSWSTYPGSLSEAKLVIEPKGLFMEYGLYLSFSSDDTPWNEVSDTLEVVMNFELPPEAVVFDSWLWVGDEIVRADILDKWTASLIYESIVNRRRDPSILTKLSQTSYELRVFPMAGNEIRKVKIAYMMPTSWTKQNVSASLPLGLFWDLASAPPYFDVVTRTDAAWSEPIIVQDSNLEFEPIPDSTSGSYMKVAIPSHKYEGNLDIGFKTPIKDGLYFSNYENGGEGIYQVAFFPSDLLDTIAGSKVAILLDYDVSNTTLGIPDLLDMAKNEMLSNLSPRDSFNLFFSKLSIGRYSEEWVAATPDNIHAVFASLKDPLSSYSNLASLLGNGVDFINTHGNSGQIVLITCADQYDRFEVANTLINDLLELMERPIPIHIADYQSRDITEYYFNRIYYRGNGYLYNNLAKLTAGSCQRYMDIYEEREVIGRSFLHLGGSIHSFDLHTSMSSGFCHSRYLIGGDASMAYIHNAILQIGKYRGSFPFELEFSGEYHEQVFNKNLTVNQEDAIQMDTLAEEIWTGQYIQTLESGQQSNDIINEIIYNSLTERVLSRYTSFLCLEPGMNPEDFDDEVDDRILISDEARPIMDSIRVFPNPFTDFVTIELQADQPQAILDLSIYSLTGTLLFRFDLDELQQSQSHSISWNGTATNGNPLNPGVYLLVYRTADVNKTIKLIKQ